MKNNVFTVMKKECKRIISDRKLFFTTVLLPGILMYTMYSLMGTFMVSVFTVEDNYQYQVHAVNLPESVAQIISRSEES
ncbi:MAG: hypothetical protein LBI27_02195, partial [Clostridiales bacterium]|nr:hypothetical protein [Clostridiales bacterium]